MRKGKHYPHWNHPNRKQFLGEKRRDAKVLLAAIKRMRYGMAYLPPAKDRNAAGHMAAVERWIKEDCRPAWRHA